MCKIYIQKQNIIFLPSIWNKIWDNYVFLQILHSMPTFLNWGCRCIAGSLKLVTALCSLWIVKCQTCPPAQVEMWLQPLSLTQKALNMRQESITVCTLMKVASCHSELLVSCCLLHSFILTQGCCSYVGSRIHNTFVSYLNQHHELFH